MMSSVEAGSSLLAAGHVKSCSGTGFIPTVIQSSGGWEGCSKRHWVLTFPCGRSVGGVEAAWE